MLIHSATTINFDGMHEELRQKEWRNRESSKIKNDGRDDFRSPLRCKNCDRIRQTRRCYQRRELGKAKKSSTIGEERVCEWLEIDRITTRDYSVSLSLFSVHFSLNTVQLFIHSPLQHSFSHMDWIRPFSVLSPSHLPCMHPPSPPLSLCIIPLFFSNESIHAHTVFRSSLYRSTVSL